MTSEDWNFLLSMIIGAGIVFAIQFLWYKFRGYK